MTFANGSNAYIFYQKYLETFLKKNRIYKQTCCKNKKHMELYNRKNCTYLETFLKKRIGYINKHVVKIKNTWNYIIIKIVRT